MPNFGWIPLLRETLYTMVQRYQEYENVSRENDMTGKLSFAKCFIIFQYSQKTGRKKNENRNPKNTRLRRWGGFYLFLTGKHKLFAHRRCERVASWNWKCNMISETQWRFVSPKTPKRPDSVASCKAWIALLANFRSPLKSAATSHTSRWKSSIRMSYYVDFW